MFDWIKGETAQTDLENDTALSGDGYLITGQNGLLAGTHVVSNLGWRKVEALSIGDKVLTFDNAMQTVTGIQRETLWIAEASQSHPETLPVHVPSGALNNRRDLWLMSGQGLMIESDSAMDALGDPFAVIAAQVLTGYRGITRAAPAGKLEIVILSFARDEVIYVEGGLLAYCPLPRDILLPAGASNEDLYDVLDLEEGRGLVQQMIAGQQTRGFTYERDEVACLS
ncbi:MAG: Hint domain-containing protein [Paracoccaceae bacterium]